LLFLKTKNTEKKLKQINVVLLFTFAVFKNQKHGKTKSDSNRPSLFYRVNSYGFYTLKMDPHKMIRHA